MHMYSIPIDEKSKQKELRKKNMICVLKQYLSKDGRYSDLYRIIHSFTSSVYLNQINSVEITIIPINIEKKERKKNYNLLFNIHVVMYM